MYEALRDQLQQAQEQNRQCNYAAAEAMARKVLRQCDDLLKQPKERKERFDEFYAFGNRVVAESLMWRGDFNSALEFAEVSSLYSELLGDDERIQCGLILALLYSWKGEHEPAFKHLNRIEAIAIKAGNKKHIAEIKEMAGFLLHRTGDFRGSIAVLEEALEIAGPLHLGEVEAKALGTMGLCYSRLGDYDRAKEYCEDSFNRFKAMDHLFGIALGFSNLGRVFLVHGGPTQALYYLQEALNIQQQVGMDYFDIPPKKWIGS